MVTRNRARTWSGSRGLAMLCYPEADRAMLIAPGCMAELEPAGDGESWRIMWSSSDLLAGEVLSVRGLEASAAALVR